MTRTLVNLPTDSLIHFLEDNLYSEDIFKLSLVHLGDSLWFPVQTFWIPAGPDEEIVLEGVEIKKSQPMRSDIGEILGHLSLFDPDSSSINLNLSSTISVLGDPKNFRGIKFYPLIIPLIVPQGGRGESHWIQEIDVRLKREGREVSLNERLSRLSPMSYRLVESLVGEAVQPLQLAGTVRSYSGYYLVVSRQEALRYAIPLLEWKRRMGYRVEVLTYSSGARADEIKRDIQTRYDQLRDSGEEPFDYILILGDRSGQPNTGPWTLPSFEGRPSMPEFPNHADFVYGLLEGGEDDPFPDAGVGRFGSGSEDRMRMAVARTLAYERTPYQEDREWFSRAGVFSQRWGEDWNFSLILTTRWGERILERSGYRELLIQETDGGEDGQGRLVAQALANWLNQTPPALMIGRAQIDYWHNSLIGVESGSVFPIGINFTGHGEFTMNTLFNSGTPEDLKGVVAWTTGWGTPQTLFSNGIWMAMVQGLLVHKLPLGMMRVYAGISLARIFPEMEDVIWTYQTDLDLYGDPGLMPWIGEPKDMVVIHPDTIPMNSSSLGVRIIERQSGTALIEAQVGLYITGDVPEPDEYPQWTPFYQKVGWTDDRGEIVLPLPSNLPQGIIFLTVTKQGYLPYEGEIVVTQERRWVTIIRADIDDREAGNGDSQLNPGEEVQIYPYVSLFGEDELDTLRGRVVRSSSYLTVRDSSLMWSSLNPGQERRAYDPLALIVNPNVFDGSDHWIDIVLDHPQGEVEERIWWDIRAPQAEIVQAIWDTSNGLRIQLLNSGRLRLPRSYLVLERVTFMADVEPDTLILDALDPGEIGVPENEGYFHLRLNPMFFPGLPLQFNLLLISLDETWRQSLLLTVVSSERITSTMPLPPDHYGYVALDNSDTLWSGAPSFRWFEITPVGSGGERNGIRLPLGPSLYGAAVAIDLPFSLRFYGEEFNRLTVTTNGFVSPGDQVRNVNY
ncbi:MAG: C25 family cysteine peptidase, partial [bacterium]